MKTKSLQWGLATLLLASFALPSSASAASVNGRIVSLSPAARTVAIQNNDGTQVILCVGERSLLARNGAPVPFAALALRDRVSVQFQPATSTIGRLTAQGPNLTRDRGLFAGFNAGTGVLTMATLHGAKSFRVGPSTLVVRNGAPATAQGLARGDALLVHAIPAAAGALALAADIAADGPEEEDVEGTITTIAGQDVTITPEHHAAVTVHVAAGTVITLTDATGRHSATLADLATGMKAEADYDPVSLVADHIRARVPQQHQAHVRGTVSAVDATAGTIAITPEHGAVVALETDSSTRITLNGAAATLADIQLGAGAAASYDATTMLATRIDARSVNPIQHVEGLVTATSATGLTIAAEHGTPVTLIVNSTTQVFVNGAAATLADVHVGDRAEARYDRATMIATILLARTPNPHPFRQVEGLVSAVSATGFTVTPEHGAAITLIVDATTRIFKGFAPGTLADITVGARVHAAYDGTTLIALLVHVSAAHVELSEIHGTATAASATAITITPAHGAAVTLAIDAATVITNDHHPVTAADIHVGDSVEAHYEGATLLAKRIEIEHSGGHH